MIEAIIYESNTGFTEKYAQMLSKKLNLPSCPAGKMKKTFSPGIEVIYMGWICDKRIRGLEKLRNTFASKPSSLWESSPLLQVLSLCFTSTTTSWICLSSILGGGIRREKLSHLSKTYSKLDGKKAGCTSQERRPGLYL